MVCVGGGKSATQTQDVVGVFQLHIGVSKMELDPATQVRILCASGELVESVLLERVEAAECAQSFRVLRRLLAGPIVFRAHPGVFIVEAARGTAVDVGDGKQQCSSNPC